MERDSALDSNELTSESGVTLILSLLAMVIISATVQRVLLYAAAYHEATIISSRSIQAMQNERARLQPITNPQRSCLTQRISASAQPQRDWVVCSRGAPPFLLNQPISLPSGRINYDALFASPDNCPGSLRTNLPGLTLTSPETGVTCHTPSIITDRLIVLTNIACHDLAITKPRTLNAVTIATPGSLTCQGALSVSSSALILAGGDIKIAALRSSSLAPISVTLLSAHGEVVVGSVSSGLSLLALSRKTLSVPTTERATTYPLPPYTRIPISGIRLQSDG